MAAACAIESLGLSERRACLLTGVSPSVYRYQPKQGDDDVLRRRMGELAGERKRFGSPRLHIMLKREGLVVNHKRTERIYSEEGLALRKKSRRKGAARARETVPSLLGPLDEQRQQPALGPLLGVADSRTPQLNRPRRERKPPGSAVSVPIAGT